jgi:glycosyltransferase involved in cell wall biosynthesis
MRSILVLTSTYPRWQGDTNPAFVDFLCRQLTGKYRIIVLAPHYPGAKHSEHIDGIEVHRFRYFLPFAEKLAYDGGIIENLKRTPLKWLLVPFFLVSQALNMVLLARRHKVSLIHAHWIIPQGLLAVLGRQLRFLPKHIRILCTSHGGDLFSLQGGLLQSLKRYTLRHCDHTTVVSKVMRDHLVSMGCEAGNVSVQSMGVDLANRFVPGPGEPVGTDLVYVGRLVEKKGVSTLLDTINLLKDSHPGLSATLVGDGPERDTLDQQATALGINKQVTFLGAIPNDHIPAIYQSARIAVVPSIVAADGDQEGLGLVAVEALGCGCATVVSDLPALADVVTHNENGLVFMSGDATQLKKCIAMLLDDRDLYERLTRNARTSVVDKFDWHAVGARYLDIIDGCIESR